MAANTVLTTNFNVTPYYDDYGTGDKGYYRILFKPGFSVQARELTQIQTMLQEQISRMGKNMYKDGSIIEPGGFNFQMNPGTVRGTAVQYVKVKDTNITGAAVNVQSFLGKTIKGNTYGITATVIDVKDGNQNNQNTKTIYVSYSSGSTINTNIKTFQPNEHLLSSVGSLVANTTSTTGFGSRFSIEAGKLFAKGHFIKFPKQSVIIERYNPAPSKKVGFLINEDIISSDSDSSLLDPALEASNYSAPGADRFKLSTQLTTYDLNEDVDDANYVPLFECRDGTVIRSYERTQFNVIMDELARRTYDESGDYIVKGHDIQLVEHDKTADNNGRYADGNNKLLLVNISPGTSYVHGYETTTIGNVEYPIEKGLAVANSVGTPKVTSTMGSYIVLNELVGGWQLDRGNQFSLRNAASLRITNKGGAAVAAAGSEIGTCKLLSLEWISGIEGYNAVYNAYITDIKMNSGYLFSDVKSIYRNNSGYPDAGADVVLGSVANNSVAILYDSAKSALLYYAGSRSIKSLRQQEDPSVASLSFNYLKTSGLTSSDLIAVAQAGTISISAPGGNEVFPYGTGPVTLSTSDKRDIRLAFNGYANVSLSGTVTANAGQGATNVISGAGTQFSKLNVGDKIRISGVSNYWSIASKSGDYTATVVGTLPAGITGNTITKVYYPGDLVDMSGIGVSSSSASDLRSITATDTSLTFNLKETYDVADLTATVTYPLYRTNSREGAKVLKASRFVKINLGAAPYSTNLTGPFNLGFSDVYRIVSIRKKTSSFPTSSTDGTDVTDRFRLDNGQRDSLYDHASLIPFDDLTTNDRLLVELDYFLPNFSSGAGYFSIDSYPIQDDDGLFVEGTNIRTENVPIYVSPTTGSTYDLRNHIDFRPVKANFSTDATTVSAASTNPVTPSTQAFTYTNSLRLVQPNSDVTYEYNYYLGRVDLVVLGTDGKFSVVSGKSATVPKTPTPPSDKMVLATIQVYPYPSLAPSYANYLNRKDLACIVYKTGINRFTMKDISRIRDRVNTLEYYNTLSLLEKRVADLKVMSPDGYDRFKNGFFVDSFVDNTLSINGNNWCVDTDEGSMRPIYTMFSFLYEYMPNLSVNLGTICYNNETVMLKPTGNVNFLEQTTATSDRNLERSTYEYVGNLSAIPAADVWVDTTYLPDDVDRLPNFQANAAVAGGQVIGTSWNEWKKTVTGYLVIDTNGQQAQVATLQAARQKAEEWNGDSTVTIREQYDLDRTRTDVKTQTTTQDFSLGYSVRDAKVIPYIRPQSIYVKGINLKPNTAVWCFFDSINVSNTCRQMDETTYNYIAAHYKSPFSYQYDVNGANVSVPGLSRTELLKTVTSNIKPYATYSNPMVTNPSGKIFFEMFLDGTNRFRTGDHNIIVTDSRTYVDPASIDAGQAADTFTTGARVMWTADGMAITKQRNILSTRTINTWIVQTPEHQESYTDSVYPQDPPPQPFPWWLFSHICVAYSFIPKVTGNEEGLFLESADIFVSRKSANPDRGMWFEIREMDNAGGITRNQVPFSEVHYSNSELPISPDGKTNPLNIKFSQPIFLYKNIQYALVLHSNNADPDTYIWVSRLGEADVNTGKLKTSRPMSGNLYTTNNDVDWDIVKDADLTCKFYRCEFSRNTIGTAIIGNKPTEKLIVSYTSKNLNDKVGAIFSTGDRLTLSGANGVAIYAGDVIRGGTSGASSTIISNTGMKFYTSSNSAFRNGEQVNIFTSGGTYKQISATVSRIDNSWGYLYEFHGLGGTSTSYAHLIQSSGDFKAGDRIYCEGDNSYNATVVDQANFRYSALSFEPHYIDFLNTSLAYEIMTTSNTGVTQSYTPIERSTTVYFNTEQALYSRTNELESGKDHTNRVKVLMRTTSNVVTPVLDLGKTNSIYIDNIISNNYAGETNPDQRKGSLINRYISKTVTLAEGQDAEDIKVYLTAYRPPGTDVRVWVKILNREDQDQNFANRPWVELENKNGTGTYSSMTSRNDFREFEYGFYNATTNATTGAQIYGNGSKDLSTGIVTYTSGSANYTGYKYFAIKIGLLLQDGNDNTAVVPRAADLRAIALQM